MTDRSHCQNVLERSHEAIEPHLRLLKHVDIDLAYLTLLTREGLKPLSRWEKPLEESAQEALRRLGLCVERIPRRLRSGKRFEETIFARNPAHLQIYAEHFRDRPVDKSAETVRIEGFLFGYPPCCIAQYIKQPYAPHDFPMERQQVLFHWSCKGCEITPSLVPHYERIHHLIEDL
jgi:hypothetical protein